MFNRKLKHIFFSNDKRASYTKVYNYLLVYLVIHLLKHWIVAVSVCHI